MALSNISLALASVVWRYDFQLAPSIPDHIGEIHASGSFGRRRAHEFQLKATITSLGDGPHMIFRKRDHNIKNLE